MASFSRAVAENSDSPAGVSLTRRPERSNKRSAHGPLQSAYLSRQSRLADATQPGGDREPAGSGYLVKGKHMIEVHCVRILPTSSRQSRANSLNGILPSSGAGLK